MYIFKSKGKTTTASSLRDSNESMCPNEVRLPEKLNRNPTSNMEEQDLKLTRPKGGFFCRGWTEIVPGLPLTLTQMRKYRRRTRSEQLVRE
jgi:hypothetical protein